MDCAKNHGFRKKKKSRSKRRSIYCPIHNCYLDSVSQKYFLFAHNSEQLQARGMKSTTAKIVIKAYTTVSIRQEWLEAFWCSACQSTHWFHVCKSGDRFYEISHASAEMWQSVAGVVHPNGNPSVGEFTRRESRMKGYQGLKAYNTIR